MKQRHMKQKKSETKIYGCIMIEAKQQFQTKELLFLTKQYHIISIIFSIIILFENVSLRSKLSPTICILLV